MKTGMAEASPHKHKIIECDLCKSAIRSDNFKRHRGGKFCRKRCNVCGLQLHVTQLERHTQEHSLNLSVDLNPSPEYEKPDTDEMIEEELRELYKTHYKQISSYEKFGTLADTFNYRINIFSASEIAYCFRQLFRKQKNAFRISLSVGYILLDTQTEEYAYYGSSLNNQLLIKSRFIRNSDDKTNLIADLNSMDLCRIVERPTSQWVYIKATNLTFFIYRLKGTPIGSPVQVPNHFHNNKGLHCLTKSAQTGALYNDRKCFFRCLSLFRGHNIKSLEKSTDELVKEFCTAASINELSGVTLDMLEELSRMFNVPISVYSQDEDRNTDLIYSSTKIGEKSLCLLLHEDHFMYIKDLDKFSSTYRCRKCDKIFPHHGTYKRHERTCDANVRYKYIGGAFSIKQTVFEELESYGIFIPKELRLFSYLAVFDIECMQVKATLSSSSKTDYITKHELVSVSVCSNVPNFEKEKCFLLSKPGKQKELVKQMLDYLREISDQSAFLMRESLSEYVEHINNLEEERIKDRFEEYISQLPVLSFNGG